VVGNMKLGSLGISVSINVIIILVISIIALLTLITFFISNFSGRMSEAEAIKIWSDGCNKYCSDPWEGAYATGIIEDINELSGFEKKFNEACITLGYATKDGEAYNTLPCLQRCNCEPVTGGREGIEDNMEKVDNFIERGLNRLQNR